jgi:hypothetical protein
LKIVVLILLMTIISCTSNRQNPEAVNTPNNQVILDTRRYTIISEDTTFKVSNDDVQLTYQVLKNVVDSLNKHRNKPLDISQYRFQTVPLPSKNGQRVFWVNSFCNGGDQNWKTQIYQVEDGGKCFFNIKIDLTTMTYFDLFVNSLA